MTQKYNAEGCNLELERELNQSIIFCGASRSGKTELVRIFRCQQQRISVLETALREICKTKIEGTKRVKKTVYNATEMYWIAYKVLQGEHK